MENFEFGNDFVIAVFFLGLFAMLLCTIMPLLIIHVISKRTAVHMKQVLRTSSDSEVAFAITYELSWLVIMPVVFTATMFILHGLVPSGFLFEYLMQFDLLTWLLFSFTIWNYDERLRAFKQKSIGKFLVYAIIFVTFDYVFSFLMMGWQPASYGNYRLSLLMVQLVKPGAIIVLMLFLIRRNRINAAVDVT